MRLPSLLLLLLLSATASAGEVPSDAFDVRPLLAGQQAPKFTATSAAGEVFEFDPLQRDKPALIVFYRGGWCPYCNIYWQALRQIEDELLASGVELMFLSADSPQVLAEAVSEGAELNYRLLSDNSMAISRAFGIAFQVDAATVARYKSMNIDLERSSGYTHHQLPVPAAFIVDTDGVIKFQYVNPDYKVRLSPEVLLAAAQTMPSYQIRR